MPSRLPGRVPHAATSQTASPSSSLQQSPSVKSSTGTRSQRLVYLRESVILAAQGLLSLHTKTLQKHFIVGQNSDIPESLHTAQFRMGRLFTEAGLPDVGGSVHDFIARFKSPLATPAWDLAEINDSDFEFQGALLLDPSLDVPTDECAQIANAAGGLGTDQVVEDALFSKLHEMCDAAAERRPKSERATTVAATYTILRELLTRYSLITLKALRDYLAQFELDFLYDDVANAFYQPVPMPWTVNGLAQRCAHCGSLLHKVPDSSITGLGRCALMQCAGTNHAVCSEELDPYQDQVLIARAQVLRFWTGPGIDELRIHDAAVSAGYPSRLYPFVDAADVSLSGDLAIGVDVKCYNSPEMLGRRLNAGIGRLAYFKRKILAVSDSCMRTTPDYMDRLIQTINSDPKSEFKKKDVRLMTVKQVIECLPEIYDAV